VTSLDDTSLLIIDSADNIFTLYFTHQQGQVHV
jgi:hypothetical protein